MTNRELFSALGQLDDDLILAAAPQSRRHSSPMLLRWGALAAGLVLAVGIAFAVAPRLPAILPPNTDTSHIQGTTNTTDQTDSSDTETDSSTNTNTDSSTGNSSDTKDEPKELVLFVDGTMGVGAERETSVGKISVKSIQNGKFSFDQTKTTVPQEYAKEVRFTIDGQSIVGTPHAAYNAIVPKGKSGGEELYLVVKNDEGTRVYYTSENQVVSFYRSVPKSDEHLKESDLIARATEVAETVYGKSTIADYKISAVVKGENNASGFSAVRFSKYVHGRETDDCFEITFRGNALVSINAYKMGYMNSSEQLTSDRIQTAEKMLTDLELSLSSTFLTVNEDGDFFLSGYGADSQYWISIP